MRWKVAAAIVIVFLLWGCDLRYGTVEANFQLSQGSRLPKWFQIPTNYTRQDLTMTETIYNSFSGQLIVKMVLVGPGPEHKIISEKIGSMRMHPLSTQAGYDKYPLYSIITVDGMSEVFEQRRPEAIEYISDDPKYTSFLKQEKGSGQ